MGISFSATHEDRATWFTSSHAGPSESHLELFVPLNVMGMLPLIHSTPNKMHMQYFVTSTHFLDFMVRILNIFRDPHAVCWAPVGDASER